MPTTNRRWFLGAVTGLVANIAAFGRGLLDEARVHHDPLGRLQLSRGYRPEEDSMFKGGTLYARASFKVDDERWRKAWANLLDLEVRPDGTIVVTYREGSGQDRTR